MKVGERISQLRKLHNMQQKELAAKLDIPATTLSGYENNHREPGIDVLKKLSKIFNVSLDFLISGNANIIDERIYKLVDKLIKGSVNQSLHWENALTSDRTDNHYESLIENFYSYFLDSISSTSKDDIINLFYTTNKNMHYILSTVQYKSDNVEVTYISVGEYKDNGTVWGTFNYKILGRNSIYSVFEEINYKVAYAENINELLTIIKSKETGESDFIESLIESLDFED